MKKRGFNKTKVLIKDILKGKFISDEKAGKYWGFLIYLVFLCVLMIVSSHFVNSKSAEISRLKEETAEIRTQYAEIHYELMKLKLESELINQVSGDSLMVLEKNPQKIIVKKVEE